MERTSLKPLELRPSFGEGPRKCPEISNTRIVGGFSADQQRQYHEGFQNCKYLHKNFHPNRVHYDLNVGIERAIQKPDNFSENEKINHLLHFISTKFEDLRNTTDTYRKKPLKADIVCFRGLLRLLMCSAYERREGWTILATKYKGTIYLCARETDQKREEIANRSQKTKNILSYGYKFEQYIFTDDPEKAPNTDLPVNENEEFCCMFTSKMDDKLLLYGAEIDGIESDKAIDLENTDPNSLKFVEAKVNLRPIHHRQNRNLLQFKYRNWWCQSVLVNVSKIIVGTRNDGGIVTEISELAVADIPNKVDGIWKPYLCWRACDEFLELVKKTMISVNCPQTVYRFDYDPLESPFVHLQRYNEANEFSFLPKWYYGNIDTLLTELE